MSWAERRQPWYCSWKVKYSSFLLGIKKFYRRNTSTTVNIGYIKLLSWLLTNNCWRHVCFGFWGARAPEPSLRSNDSFNKFIYDNFKYNSLKYLCSEHFLLSATFSEFARTVKEVTQSVKKAIAGSIFLKNLLRDAYRCLLP